MTIFQTPPSFVEGRGLAAPDINLLLQNAIALDILSYRIEPANDAGGAKADPVSAYADGDDLHQEDDFVVWAGTVEYRVGYTALAINGYASGALAIEIFLQGILI